MAEAGVDSDYHGRPVTRRLITDDDRAAFDREDLVGLNDALGYELPDGRSVFRCGDGVFLRDPKTGLPDRSRPVDDWQPPSLEEALRAAGVDLS